MTARVLLSPASAATSAASRSVSRSLMFRANAASIVAKVTRDRLMREADLAFPAYGFARHKGYATPEHLAAIDRHGLCSLHRRSFVSAWRQGQLFVFDKDD